MSLKSLLVFVTLVSILLAGCAASGARGQVVAEGTKLGSWVYFLDGSKGGCRGGFAEHFLRADLFLKDATLRVLNDARVGPVLEFMGPGGQPRVELTRESCSTLDLKIDRLCDSDCIETFGTAAFTCNAPDGGKFSGQVSFRCW